MGHIALPVPVCHPMFFDQILRLLRSVCVYCHHLRISEVEVNRFACKLELLQHGLVTEATDVDFISTVGRQTKDGEEPEGGEDPDLLMAKRKDFVKKAIRLSKERIDSRTAANKATTVGDERRILIREFMRVITLPKKCARCSA